MPGSSAVESPYSLGDPTGQVSGAGPGGPANPGGWRTGWNRRRFLSIGGVAVLLAAAVLGTWEGTKGGGSSSAPPLAVTTQRVTVSTGTIKQTVSASGTIEPAAQANLSFAVSGDVDTVDVAVGQQVAAGQTLATIDPKALQYQADAAQESLSAAESRLSTDESNSASTSQIDSDQAAVTSAQSQLASAQKNLSDATLTSTIAGTVASVNLSVGQAVSGGGSGAGGNGGTGNLGSSSASSASSSSSSSAQIVVVSTSSYVVDATVDDTEVGQIQTGDQATIVPSGSTSQVYGTVSSVGLVAESSGSGGASVASFPVVIGVTGTPSGLYAGTTASATVIVKQLDNVVVVPTAAISYASGRATVTKVVGGGQVSQPVTTGASASGETQVTGGLKAGDVIMERVVHFNGSAGSTRNLFGGSGPTRRFGGAGGFPGGALGGFGGRGGASVSTKGGGGG